MFELHIADTDVTSGSIPVTWCLDKELLEELNNSGVKDPQVVICVTPVTENFNGTMEYRKVVPLKDMMAYIDFRYPGKNRIYGLISFSSAKRAKERYLEKHMGTFWETVANASGDDYCYRLLKDYPECISKPIDVEVPQECFAKEPSEAEKDWLAYLGKNKFTDECSLRKRRFLYPFQAVLFMLDILARVLLFIIAALLGSRSLSPKYVLHPLTYNLVDTITDTFTFPEGTYFIGKTSNKYLNYATLVFTPMVIVLAYAGILKPAFGLALLIILVPFLVIGATLLTIRAISNFLNSRSEDKEVEDNGDPWYMDPNEMVTVLCSGDKKPLKVADLPSKKRTLKLRFQELKSQVCKPFAG